MSRTLRLFHRAARQVAEHRGITVAAVVAACNRAVEPGCNDDDDSILNTVHDLMLAADSEVA